MPDSISNQIAAGEVVNRPASAVKELIENAVDAGSTSVTVNYRDGGKELIQIVDDGCGMSPIDLRLAFERHATSKIARAEDIYSLTTFGFRGEALASIAAVAEVEARSRQKEAQLGHTVEIAGGAFRHQEKVSCPEGTQFLIKNLFYNIPARRRFLKDSATESRHIKDEFRRVALCHPDISFLLYENDAPVYNLPATTLKQRIVAVSGKSSAANLIEISADTSVVRLSGYIGRPSAARQNNKEQYLFVNGRYFKCGYFHKAIMQAYDKLLPAGTQPSYFLYMQIDPERIDVNVHPQKTEVKFEDQAVMWQIIVAAVKEGLGKGGIVPMMDFDSEERIEIPPLGRGGNFAAPSPVFRHDYNPFMDSDNPEFPRGAGGVVRDRGESYVEYPSVGEDNEGDDSLIEYIEGDETLQSKIEFNDGEQRFKGALPFAGGYIATNLSGRLAIVDVRRAWESVLYSRYLMMMRNESTLSTQLLFPHRVCLSADESSLAATYAGELSSLGFEMEIGDDHHVTLIAIPADLMEADVDESLRELISVLEHDPGSAPVLRRERLAAKLARRGSYTHPVVDTPASATYMLDMLNECENYNFTPSGLRVFTLIGKDEIDNRF